MKFTAILAKTTTDMMKSKILSGELSQLVLDVYMTPQDFAELISQYNEEEFIIEIKKRKLSQHDIIQKESAT